MEILSVIFMIFGIGCIGLSFINAVEGLLNACMRYDDGGKVEKNSYYLMWIGLPCLTIGMLGLMFLA